MDDVRALGHEVGEDADRDAHREEERRRPVEREGEAEHGHDAGAVEGFGGGDARREDGDVVTWRREEGRRGGVQAGWAAARFLSLPSLSSSVLPSSRRPLMREAKRIFMPETWEKGDGSGRGWRKKGAKGRPPRRPPRHSPLPATPLFSLSFSRSPTKTATWRLACGGGRASAAASTTSAATAWGEREVVGGQGGGWARRAGAAGAALRERWRRNQSSAASTMAPRPLSSRHQTHMHRGERQRAGRGARLEPSAGGAQAGRAHTRRTRSNAHRVMCGDAWRRPENHGGGQGAASTRMWRRSQRPPAHSPSPARRAARRPRAPYGQQLRECAVEGRRRQRRRKREWGRATLRWGLRAPAVSRASDPATP